MRAKITTFLFLFLLLISTMLNAQVRIKERVEIRPKEQSYNTTTNYYPIVRSYVLQYPAEVRITNPYVRYVNDRSPWTISCNGRNVTIYPSYPDDYENPYSNYWVGGSYGIFPVGTELIFDRVYDSWMDPRYIAEGYGYPWPDDC